MKSKIYIASNNSYIMTNYSFQDMIYQYALERICNGEDTSEFAQMLREDWSKNGAHSWVNVEMKYNKEVGEFLRKIESAGHSGDNSTLVFKQDVPSREEYAPTLAELRESFPPGTVGRPIRVKSMCMDAYNFTRRLEEVYRRETEPIQFP